MGSLTSPLSKYEWLAASANTCTRRECVCVTGGERLCINDSLIVWRSLADEPESCDCAHVLILYYDYSYGASHPCLAPGNCSSSF